MSIANKRNNLHYWLKSTDSIFLDFDKYTLDVSDKLKRRIFIDRGANILFVAHVDTVLPPKFVKRTRNRIYAQGLDDRIGCMTAYALSEKLGADLLLTDFEESCRTTAEYHNCKDYNWIAEFDRAGSDVVTYGLDCPEFLSAIKSYWVTGSGSYSDICELKTESCCFNLGVGYKHAHAENSYINLRTLKAQNKLFIEFFNEYKDIKFVRDSEKTGYNDFGYSELGYLECELCGSYFAEYVFEHHICKDCFEVLFEYNAVY